MTGKLTIKRFNECTAGRAGLWVAILGWMLTSSVFAAGTFLSAPGRADMLFDDTRGLIYISAGPNLLRYSVEQNAFLAPVVLGGTLQGIDISPDMNTLAVADKTLAGDNAQVHIIDLDTLQDKPVTYKPSYGNDGGTNSVAFGADGALLIATRDQWGSLFRYDLATKAMTAVVPQFRQHSMLCASADRSVIGFAEGNISSGPFGRYRVSDKDVLRKMNYNGSTNAFNYEIGVSRDGSQYAIPTYMGTYIYDLNLNKTGPTIGIYAGQQPVGVAYSPVADIVYFAFSGTTKVYAYNSITFERVDEFDFTSRFSTNGNHPYVDGRLKTSRDGRYLLASVSGGVRFLRLSKPPVADDQEVVLDEDTSAQITLTATDPDNDPLSYVVTTPPAHGILSGTAPNLVYTPVADYNGPDAFIFKATDGDMESTPALVQLLVQPTPDAPVAQSNTITTPEDTPVEILLSGTDVDGEALTFRIIGGPDHGILTGSEDRFTYTPGQDYNGTDSLQYVANDGVLDSAPATITLIVTSVADTPVAHGQTIFGTEDEPVAILLTGTSPDGAALTFTVTRQPASGRLEGAAPNLLYTPNANYYGGDSFAFRVSDGVSTSSEATVSLNLSPVNDVPMAKSAKFTGLEDTPLPILLEGSDIENNPLEFVVTKAPNHGNLSGVAPNLVYMPEEGYHGQDSFEFVTSDGHLQSEPGLITIFVGSVNDAPVAEVQSIITDKNTAVDIILKASDPDGDELEYLLKSLPAHGRLSGDLPNLRYTPDKKFEGEDSFLFKVEDGELSSVARVTIYVAGNNQRPRVDHQVVITRAGTGVAFTLTGESLFGQPLDFIIEKAPRKGTLTGSGANYTYTPAEGFSGSEKLKVKAVCGGVQSKTGTVKLIVSRN